MKFTDMKSIVPILIIFVATACAQQGSTTNAVLTAKGEKNKALDSLQTAYFASGCFWCVEAVFESVEGVIEAESGYAGGQTIDPSYEEVCSGTTGHAETTKVYYDSTIISFQELVDVFFNSHDPSTKNQQGPDSGTQYRSIAFYRNLREKQIIEDNIFTLLTEKVYASVTTEVLELDTFYVAEEYHQDYVKNHMNQPYVQGVSLPRVKDFKRKMPEVLK